MNKKGITVVTIVFWAFIFVVFWALTFAPMLSYWGHAAVVNNNLTGIEALFYDNVNFVIGICFGLFVIAFSLFGGSE